MPRVTMMKLLGLHNKIPSVATDDDEFYNNRIEKEAIREHIKDTGFSVYSDAIFLY